MNESTKWLYEKLSSHGYNVGASADIFDSLMVNNPESRKWAYNTAQKHGYNVGEYDMFERLVGAMTDGVETTESGSVVVSPAEAKENADSINQFLENRDTLYTGLQDYDTGIVSGTEQRRRDDAAAEAEVQAEAMRQRLQEDGTIDRMKESRKEARREKLLAFGSMLGSTPQVTSFGVSTNVFDSTDEQLADVRQALDAGTEYRQNKLLQEKLDVALDMARAGENQDGLRGVENFGLGLWDSATRLSTWDFGASDIVNNLTLQQIVEKWENDPSSLTATEQKVLDGIGMATAVQELYSDQVGIGYNVGKSLPESAGFMASMALNPASGLGKSLARNAVRTYGRKAVGKIAARRALGDLAETAIMTATTGAGRVAADALERINGSSTYEIGKNGIIMYGGQKDQETVGNAVIKAIGSNFIENYSEALGEYFDPLLGMSRKVAAGGLRKMNLDKWADALSDVQPSQMTASIRALREKAKFGGILGEVMEEEVGMALNAISGVGDYTFSKEKADKEGKQWIFDLENQLTIVLSCAIMSGTLNGVEQVSNVAARRRMEKNAKNAEQEASYRFHRDEFAPLREAIDQASPEGMVDVLRDVYMSQEYTVGQKRALAEYAAARLQLQYYNAADAKARRQVNKTQQELLDAQEAGLNAQLPQFFNIARAAQFAEDELLDYDGDFNLVDIIRSSMNRPEEMERILGDLPPREAQLVTNYIYSRARMEGAYQGRSNRAEDYIDDFAYALEPAVVTDAEGNRTITTALLGDRSVYVLENNGDLAHIMRPDGSKTLVKASELTNITTSSADEVIDRHRDMYTFEYNAETENAFEHHPKTQAPQVGLQLQSPEGEVVITAINDNMVEIVPAVYKDGQVQPKEGAEPRTITVDDAYAWQDDYYLSMDADQAYANAMAEASNMSAETNESPSFEQGDELVFYVNGEPIDADITGIDPEGNYYVHVSNLVDGLDKAVSDVYTAEELRKLTTPSSKVSEKTTKNESTPTEQIKQSVSKEITNGQTEENASEPIAEVMESVNTPQTKAAELLAELEADEVDENIVYNTQKAIDLAEEKRKAKPTMKDADGDVATFKALKAQWQAELEDAQRNVLFWNNVAKEVANARVASQTVVPEVEAEAEQPAVVQPMDMSPQPAKKAKKSRKREPVSFDGLSPESMAIANGIMADMAPQNGVELAAAMMSTGGKRIIPESFRKHTGYSTTEQKSFLGLIAGADKGGLTIEHLGELVMQADREDGTNFFDQNDANAGLNAVLEVLGQSETIGDVNDYIKRNREEAAYREAWANENAMLEAEQEAKDAWYMEQYHATEEELAAYSEYLAEITEEIIADDANYEERFNTFAELIADEYDNQGTDADIRSSADQGEGLASDREGSSSVGEGEETDRQGAVLGDAPRFAEAEDGRAGSSVSAQSDVDAEAEEWAEATIQRIRELEDEIANIEDAISEFEAGERSYIVDAEITALEDRLKDAIAERDGLLSLAEENNEGADFKSRQKKGTPAGVRVLDGKSKRASEEYARRTGWTEELNGIQLEIVDHLRGLTDEELKDFRRQVTDAISRGEDVEHYKYILDTVDRYRRSGEREHVKRDSGILPRQNVSLDKIEELFMEYNRDENLAILFDRLRPLIEKINPRFIFDIIRDADGNVADKVMGDYSLKDNLIRINYHSLYSGYQTEQEKASTIVHEMIHAITQYAIDANERGDNTLPKNVLEAAKSLVNIYNQIKDNEIFNTSEVDEEGNIIRDYGVKDVHEMISELANPEFREKLKQIDVKGKNAWERIIDAIARFINQFKDIYDTTAYGKAVRALDTLMDNFNLDAYEQSMVMSDGQALCNIRTYREFGRDRLQAYVGDKVAKGVLSAEDGADIIQQMDDIYEAVQKYTDVYVPFGNWSETEVVMRDGRPVFSVVKTNGDYKMNLDFSLVCKKRRTLDAVFDELIKRGAIENVSLEQVDIARINDIIRDHAFEVACSLCFVDAKRFRIAEVADDFCKMYNELVDKNDKQLQSIVNKTKKNTVRKKIAQLLLDEPSNRIKLSRENFMSAKGFDDMKVNAEEIMKLYNAKKGTGGPKASSADVQYHNDVLDKKWTPEAAYSVGGVRLQSFSDYVPRLVFDYIQMIADLSAEQLPVHAYTKEELFVRQFGLTGIKINMSLVPSYRADGVAAGLDKDDNYVWEQGQTFDYAEAVEIQNAEGYRENCGTIAVGVSDEHISKMLDDENIRMVIPYHKSGINKKVAVHNHIDKFTDYTNEQSTRDAKGKKLTKEMLKDEPNFNENLRKLGDPRAAAQAYLDWCDSKGYMPKFDKWRNHPNYYKLLEDFTTIIPSESGEQVVPQRGVTMTFPNAGNAFGSLESIIARGLEEDAVLEGRRDKEVAVIADEVESELLRFRESVMQGQPMFREGMGAISDREVSYENDPIAKFQGKPRYYGKKAAAFAERERRRMENAAKEAAEMLGIEAEIITDASTLQGRKAKAKGWYDIVNKKVVVVVPNHVSMGDAVRTVLHEGIAHHGLRELFGDGFDAMLDNVYNNVAPELRARIDAIAERTGVSTSVATEEYLAGLAETTNFEEAQRRGWWQQIKSYFVDMLRKLAMPGLKLKEEITDNELRYLLWRSYKNLVEPNSYLKPLGYAEDVVKQKELKVGEYAEKAPATPMAADTSEAEEWAAVTMQRIEELEAQAAQLENEIAEMEADRDADDASRYEMWEQQLEPLRKQMEDVYAELEGLYSLEAEAEEMSMASEDAIRYRLVDDPAEIERLESEPTIKAYRAMQVINGELYPPMSAVVDGKLREPIALGQWERSEERPDLADDNGRFKLDKGNKKSLKAAYNPYFHSSSTPLNDQFSEAQDRDNLVTVEVEVPVSEADGTSGYKAEKAKDAVGTHQWKAGIIQGQRTGTREVFLTRWDKPIRIVPESEVADVIVEMFGGKDIVMPSNVVTPQLRKELEARGIAFVETDNQGKLVEGEHKGEHYSKVYGKKADGLRYREDSVSLPNMNEKAEAFANIYRKSLDGDFMLPSYAEDAIENALSQIGDDIRAEHGSDTQTFFQRIGQMQYNRLMNAISNEGYGYNIPYAESWREDYADEAKDMMDEMIVYLAKERLQDAENVEKYIPNNVLSAVKPKGNVYKMLSSDVVNVLQNVTGKSKDEIYEDYAHEGDGILTDEDFDALENNERTEIIAEVERESAALGVSVRIARSVDELPDADTRKRAVDGKLKGYFDPRTGEVVLYEPNTENANDAKRTILHEIVGHKGLRQLIGEQRYDKAMLQLMYMLPADVRDAVLRRAERHGWNAAIAMDEYLADQAERDVQPTWWGKVNAKIRAILRNIGFDVKLTDADVTYLLWRSRKKLQGDSLNDMAVNAILKQAARKSVNYDVESDNSIRHRGVEQGKKISEAVSDYYEKYTATTNADKFWGGVKYMATHLGDGGMRALLNDLSESQFEDIRSVRVLEEAIESAEGKSLRENEMVHKSLNAKTSRDARDMDKSQTRYFQPMAKLLGKILGKKIDGRKIEIDDVERYLICKHSLENNEFLMKRAHAENRRKKIHERAKELMKGTMTEEEAIAQATSEYTLHQSDFRDDYSGLTELFPDDMVREAKIADRTKELTSNGVDKVTARQMASREFESYEPTLEDREKMAADEVARFEAAVDGMHEELWGIINGINRDTIERLFRSGLISRSLYNDLKKRHKFYVPLSGWKNDAAADIYNYAMYRFDGTPIQTVIKKAFGTKYQARNILGSMFAMNMAAITEGNQNLVKQKLYNLALNHDTGVLQIVDLWEVKDGEGDAAEWKPAPKPELRPTMSDAEMQTALTDYQNKLMEMERDGKARKAVNSLADNFGKHTTDKEAKRHHVELLVNGRKVVIWVNGNPKLAQAINGDLKVKKELLFFDGAVDKANRFLAQVQTSLSPEFMISNFERDILSASRYNLIKYGPKYEASFMKHLAQLMPFVSETNADMRSDVWGGAGIFNLFALDRNTNNPNRKPDAQVLDMNNPLHREFVNFLNYGGKTGYVERKQAEDLQQRIKKLSKREQSIIRKVPAEIAGWAVDTIEHLNEGIENATRFAAYLTARERGKSVTEAVFEAKEVSVNFNMQGSGAWGNASYRKLYNYFNVGLQSLRREKNLGREFPKAYIANLAFMMALGAISTVLLTADWDGDDEDEYMGLSDFNRYNYINVKTENGFIHYSLPQDLRAFYAIGCISTEWAMGKIDGSRAMQAYATQANNYTPLSFVSTTIDREPDSSPLKNLAMSFVPSAAVPVAEIAVNEDFLGRRIHNQNQWNEYEPEWQRAGYRTPEWVINASKTLSKVGGGTEHKRGVWFTEINPSNAWHIMDSYGGGFLDFAQKTYNLVERELTGEEHELRDYPMVSKFYVESGQDYSKQRVVNDRYRMYREDYETISSELNGYLKDKNNALAKLKVRAAEDNMSKLSVDMEAAAIEKVYSENVERIKNSPNYWIYESFEPYEKGYNTLDRNLDKARKSGSEQKEKEFSGAMYDVRKKLVEEIDAKRDRWIDRVRQYLGS